MLFHSNEGLARLELNLVDHGFGGPFLPITKSDFHILNHVITVFPTGLKYLAATKDSCIRSMIVPKLLQ
jgi:hypothetical protein